jgi:hypothetical protein
MWDHLRFTSPSVDWEPHCVMDKEAQGRAEQGIQRSTALSSFFFPLYPHSTPHHTIHQHHVIWASSTKPLLKESDRKNGTNIHPCGSARKLYPTKETKRKSLAELIFPLVTCDWVMRGLQRPRGFYRRADRAYPRVPVRPAFSSLVSRN